ncbi:MerR family transcriptional regulator [Polymorphospora sp. NPDC050346]|uniref:MerR family transcriptional regulator n=1 Tax=Polymorphospora sp. NPDC050346 TaxID=3155780 RepID=UPI0033DB7CB3
MRIGELAALVGVSTRTVRHYHHQGLLPEPGRRLNGYREYELRDAVVLARIRRLTELGLSLDEIRDVLADDEGRELRDVLLELDADLARQQAEITTRRDRLAALLAATDLGPDSAMSPALAEVLGGLPAGGSRFAAFDRQVLGLIEAAAEPAHRDGFAALFRPLTEPDAVRRGHALNARMDELADATPDDPRVAALAADLAAHLPDEMVTALVDSLDDPDSSHWLEVTSRELPPAQQAVIRSMVELLKEQG